MLSLIYIYIYIFFFAKKCVFNNLEKYRTLLLQRLWRRYIFCQIIYFTITWIKQNWHSSFSIYQKKYIYIYIYIYIYTSIYAYVYIQNTPHKNALIYFQRQMTNIFANINLLLWKNPILVYSSSDSSDSSEELFKSSVIYPVICFSMYSHSLKNTWNKVSIFFKNY